MLTKQGVIPVDYHMQEFVEVIRQTAPNGVGEEEFELGLVVLRGSALV